MVEGCAGFSPVFLPLSLFKHGIFFAKNAKNVFLEEKDTQNTLDTAT